MADIKDRKGQRAKKWRVRLKDGFHVEMVAKDVEVMFEKGDVFLANRPLAEKWPEKFEHADDHVPLTQNRPVITGITEDPDEERYWEPDTGPAPQTVPTVPLQKPVPPQAGNVGPTASPMASPMAEEQPKQGLKEFPKEDKGTLQHMTIRELKEYAEANEIDLEGATHKDDIINAILQASPSSTE